jgi:hypothetical protein
MPADILSLSKARKTKARMEGIKKAEQNRLLFGRTREEKLRDKSEKKKLQSLLDGAKRGTTKEGVKGSEEFRLAPI